MAARKPLAGNDGESAGNVGVMTGAGAAVYVFLEEFSRAP
jgi:hypothetical protein